MPQMTNRGLVNAMTASPVGKGTVYSAMLKVSAINRDRAAKVNNSESQRLQKITKVLDKDGRYSGWKADMEMDKARQNLMRLQAFQRVLREEYPARELARHVTNLPPQREEEGRSTTTNPEPDRGEGVKQASSTSRSESTGRNSADVTTRSHLVRRERSKRPSQGSALARDDQTPSRVHVCEQSPGQEQTHAEKRNSPGLVSSPIHAKLGSSENVKQKNVIHVPGMPALGDSDSTRRFAPLKHTTAIGESTVLPDVLVAMKTNAVKDSHHGDISSRLGLQGFIPSQSLLKQQHLGLLDSGHQDVKEDRALIRHLAVALQDGIDISSLPQAKKELLESRRRARRERTTRQIYTKGFDMNTLSAEIEREIKLMDPRRKRRRVKRVLLQDSRETVERLISRNMSKLNSDVIPSGALLHANGVTSLASPNQDTVAESSLEAADPDTMTSSSAIQAELSNIIPGDGEVSYGQMTSRTTPTALNPLLHKLPLF